MPIYAPIWGCNLGDTLWVTPLTCYVPDLVVQMLGGDARSRATAPILECLCPVEFVDRTTETPKAPIRAHVTQQILTAYGHGGKPSIPCVILKAAEVLWAVNYLKDLGYRPGDIAITNHNSGSGDPTNLRAHYVRPPTEVMNTLAKFWLRGGTHKVFQFGPSPMYHDRDPFEALPGTVVVRGLSVRELAACYHVIGRLISGDTGDYHLMLAVGGKAACLVPPHSDQMGYRYWDLHYDSICWGGERPGVRYALHNDWATFMDTTLFTLL